MKFRFNLPKIDWLNHVIGFVSVLLGVLVAFGLNSWNESNKAEDALYVALNNINNELKSNLAKIDSTLSTNQEMVDILDEYLTLVDEDLQRKVTQEEWEAFASQHPDFFKTENTSYRLTFDLFFLSRVAWETAERVGVLNSLEFELAIGLGTTYSLQSGVDQFDKNIVNQASEISPDEKESLWRFLISIQNRLNFAKDLRDEGYPEMIKAIDEYHSN